MLPQKQAVIRYVLPQFFLPPNVPLLGWGQQHDHNDCFDGETRVGALAMNKAVIFFLP